MEIPAIIITGPRRSGTHLLYRLLDHHPALFNSLTEVYFLEYLDLLSPEARAAFVDFYFSAEIDCLFDAIHERDLLPLYRGDLSYREGIISPDRLFAKVDEEALKGYVERERQRVKSDIQGIWDSWFSSLQNAMYPDQSCRQTLIKSPDYGRSARGAASFLSNFKIIFVVRNPLFAISSLRKMRSNQPNHWDLTTLRILSEVTSYQELHQTIRHFQKEYPSRSTVVRFEDVLTEPESTLQTLADFIEIPFTSHLLAPTFKGQPWHGDSSFEVHKGVSQRPLDPDRILLTDTEKRMITTCLSDLFEEQGYSPPIG